MAVSRGKMLGHFRRGCSYKCRQCGQRVETSRSRKRVEARDVAQEIAEETAPVANPCWCCGGECWACEPAAGPRQCQAAEVHMCPSCDLGGCADCCGCPECVRARTGGWSPRGEPRTSHGGKPLGYWKREEQALD